MTNLNGLLWFLIGFAASFIFFWFLSRSKKRQLQTTQANTVSQMASSLRDKISETEAEQAKISVILNNMIEGVLACDQSKRILIMNPSAESIFGISSKSTLGKSLLETTRNPVIDQAMDQAIRQKMRVTEEIELHYPERKTLRLNAIGFEPTEGSQSISGILVLYDVTEMKKLESMRQDFVANVSHELKTPLTSIKGYTETLLAGAIEDRDRAKTFLKMMDEDSERLSRLIGDLLELSKIESREILLKPEALELKKEINQVLSGFKTALDDKKIKVENQVSSSMYVFADRDRLKQILINLTENAIKFNQPEGRIIFNAVSDGNKVKIQISDTGIGISKEIIPRIFERFFRVDKARSREGGGTGLGLAIVKHLVEAHGGEIWCESQSGKGATFFFTLPHKS